MCRPDNLASSSKISCLLDSHAVTQYCPKLAPTTSQNSPAKETGSDAPCVRDVLYLFPIRLQFLVLFPDHIASLEATRISNLLTSTLFGTSPVANHSGGASHGVLGGGHLVLDALRAVRDAVPVDTIVEEAAAHFQSPVRDMTMNKGLSLASWDK